VLTLFHDFTSPASAVAVARLQRLADEGLAVEYVGFEAIGVDAALPVTLDVAAELDRIAPEAAREGVTLERPSRLPPTGLAHVVSAVADTADLPAAWRTVCYRAFWEADADLADRTVLADLAAAAGLDPALTDAAVRDRARLALFRRRTGQRRRDGVGGVPTILAQRTLVPGLLPEDDLRALAAL
jgi:2-hydroxychromene-2-carboxylate isomerase